jgi:hypothetical protein
VFVEALVTADGDDQRNHHGQEHHSDRNAERAEFGRHVQFFGRRFSHGEPSIYLYIVHAEVALPTR